MSVVKGKSNPQVYERSVGANWPKRADRAQIIVTLFHNELGREERRYRWEGPRNAPVLIGSAFQQYLREMPWRMRCIGTTEHYYLTDEKLFVRMDACFGVWWAYHAARVLLHAATHRLTRRLILTAMVWGFGHVPNGCVPSWQHLRLPWRKGKAK